MGKCKKRFNWKARQVLDVITETSRKQITVELNTRNQYDDSNPLVLPSTKRKTIVKKKVIQPVKLLSKKQRKHYEKILEKKKKKAKRAELKEALSAVRVGPEVLSKLTSITEIQTKGRKRAFDDVNHDPDTDLRSKIKLRPNVRKKGTKNVTSIRSDDPNIVGFSSSESDSESSSEHECDKKISTSDCTEPSKISESSAIEAGLEESSMCDAVKNELAETSEAVENELTKSSEVVENIAAKDINIPEAKELPKCTVSAKPKVFVPVSRDAEIQRLRLKLPIIGEEQSIMEAIHDNDVVVIAGETGSGKTTQLPQFLYEAGYTESGKLIGVTEPRRVAAISMSQRVAKELNMSTDIVSYLIRFEGNTTDKTKIKFMTDGVLLKEIQKDFLLNKYSVVILDEAHERSVFTDILIGLLSRITLLRRKRFNPLKLIIMSATLRLSDFTDNRKLFKNTPPVIKVDARQYPVTVHFNKRTAADYLEEAFKKACKIHTQLPEGGILIFLTGQKEVNTLVKKLRKTFPLTKQSNSEKTKKKDTELQSNLEGSETENSSDDEISRKSMRRKLKNSKKNVLTPINLDDYAIKPNDDEIELIESEEEDDLDSHLMSEKSLTNKNVQPMWVLPLYSLLPSKNQVKVFKTPPEGCRLCVVATNVAETSLTIPKVKYVIDSGRAKTRIYDKLTGVSNFIVSWTSKASADQRAGRAGRTAAGHCYRLYSSAIFNDEFEDWSVPEIQRRPVDDLLLQMKSMRIDRVVNFPFPSPPDLQQLKFAEKRLTLLGALENSSKAQDEWDSKLTPLGESMSAFPVAPRFAKMLCLSQQHDLLPYTVALVAALSVQEFLLAPNESFSIMWRTWAGVGNSLLLGDVMVLLRALGAAERAGSTKEGVEQFCQKCGLRYKAVVEARKLRTQLTNELNLNVPNLNLSVDPNMNPPNDKQARQLRQIIMSGMVDQVAYKLSEDELKELGLSIHKAAYRIPNIDDIIFLNSSSVLRKLKPPWIVYQEVYQLNDKLYARGITAIEAEWLPVYAPALCHISEPLKDPPPFYDDSSGKIMCHVTSTFGRSGWQLPIVQIEHPVNEEKFKWFAFYFLQGLVCEHLAKYHEELLSPSTTIFRSWAKFLISRTNTFLKALMEKNVHSKDILLERWKSDESYLLCQYLEWIPQSAHDEVKNCWPPI